MSTTVTFAGNLVDDPELHTRDDKPFVACRVLVNHRIRNEEGEWVDDEPTPHNVKVYGAAVINLYDSAGRGDRIMVHGLMRTETWNDKDSGEKRTKQVVEVSNRFGEVGGSFKFAAARIERQRQVPPASTPPPASAAASSGAGQSDGLPSHDHARPGRTSG